MIFSREILAHRKSLSQVCLMIKLRQSYDIVFFMCFFYFVFHISIVFYVLKLP